MTPNPYVQIFESIPLGVVVIDLHGHIQTMNRYAKIILDIADTPVKNEPLHTLLDPIPITDLFQDGHVGETGGTKIRRDGKILEITFARMIGEKEEPPKAVITLRDVTEMEKIQAVEKKNEMHAFIGELSADIAHEIRNPLGSIELLASLLKKESNRERDVKRANQIMAAVKTMETAISNLIHRSRKDQLPVASVNIHNLLKEILLFSEQIIDGGAVFLSARYADMEPFIECNADMMKQVFLHLVFNALTGAGRLDISTHHIEEREAIEIHFTEKSGYDPENIRSGIFNRLSCAKEDHWGLGLAIVHNIVNMYHGCMSFEYREEVGAAVVLSFPLLPMKRPELGTTMGKVETRKEANEEK
jgi:nitrogen-specific signal transduction histidine kinase